MATAGKLYTEERMTGSIASDTPFLQGSMAVAANAGAAFVDKTLTKSGTAADAKEVGDRLQKMNTAIDGKQPKGDYALKSEIPSIPDVPVKSVNNKTGDVQLSASDVGARPSTWTPSAEDVGADARGTADKKVSEHNTSDASHNDIRLLITGLTTRLNAVANSTDTDLDQLAEIVAYIKANKSLIDSITTSKVNVADIIDNLTTSVSNKPLSAKMGVQLKALIDAIKIPTTLPASDVYSWAKQPQKPSYNKTEVGLGNVNNERQYSANNPPPYPVASVNGKTGSIQLGAADVGAASAAKVSELFEAIVNKVSKTGITLDKDADGLIYIFVDGKPVGNGVEFGEIVEGDVVGYIDENNNISLTGALPNGRYTMKYRYEDGTYSDAITVVVGAVPKIYAIANNLTNCVNSNGATSIEEGSAYSATITANSGYILSSVRVTMDGQPVSVSGRTINIANVTGDIVITASATEANYTNLFVPSEATINSRLNSSAAITQHDGYVITNTIDVTDKVPFTDSTKIYIKGATFNDDGKARIYTFKTTGNTAGTDLSDKFGTLTKASMTITDEGNGVISLSGIASSFVQGVKEMVMCPKVSDSAITTADLQNIVITIDEPVG